MGAVPARFPALLLLACCLAFIGAGTGTTAKVPVVSAGAYAVQVNIPGQPAVGAGGSAAPSEVTTAAADTFAHPADASAVRTGGLSSSTFAEGTTAQGVSDVLEISLFNGEITADSVAARAKASSAEADAVGSAVTNLVLLGQGVAPGPNQRIPLGDWGYAITLELTVEAPVAEDTRNARAAVTALRVVLLADHGGLPAGTDILIGHAEAAASTPLSILAPPPVKQAKPAKPARPADVPPKKKKKKKPLPKPPEADTSQPGSVFKLPPTDVSAPLSPEGYVFPVYGPSSFTDTFGSPRAGVGWHHGEDIFAPLGAPLLAVADGTVFSVGWNELGGYRFWLRDHQGNQFYYAHLSAFSPLAVNGREVRAGAVIGFVGNTGDAQSTPYHLHFEIHPVGLLPMGYDGVVNSFPYLSAWRRLHDVSFAAGRGWAPPVPSNATAPRPGALLLGSTDISSASGLEPGSLERALVAPVSAEGDGALIRSG
jgi:murein DD-endopeptidase MepM/ murein hydrolase activator NlpD